MSDLISRQAAIEVLRNRWLKTRNYEGIGEDIAEECEIYLKTLPSAQPERKTGRWIDGSIPTYAACSECGYQERYADENNYCPHCGADMRGEQDE